MDYVRELPGLHKIDVLILTPIKEEFNGVRTLLENDREYNRIEYYRLGEVQRPDGYQLSVALRQTGPRADGITQAVHNSLREFDPQTIILFGTAGALGETQLYDVLIGTDGWSYEKVKEEESGERFVVASRRFSEYLVGQAKRILDQPGPEPWQYLIPDNGLQKTPTVMIGPITSGEKTLKDLDSLTMARINRHQSAAIGVEQEAYQFLSALPQEKRHTSINIRVASDTIAGKNLQNARGSKVRAVEVGTAFLLYFLRYADLRRSPRSLLNPKSQLKPWKWSALMSLVFFATIVGFWQSWEPDTIIASREPRGALESTNIVNDEPLGTLRLSRVPAENKLDPEKPSPVSLTTPLAPAPAPVEVDGPSVITSEPGDEPQLIQITTLTDYHSAETVKDALEPSLPEIGDPVTMPPEVREDPISTLEAQYVSIIIFDKQEDPTFFGKGPLFIDGKRQIPKRVTQSENTGTQSAKEGRYFTLRGKKHTISYLHQDSTYQLTLDVLPNKKFQTCTIRLSD